MKQLLEFLGVLAFLGAASGTVAACFAGAFFVLRILSIEHHSYAQILATISALVQSYFALRWLHRLMDEQLLNRHRPRLRRTR